MIPFLNFAGIYDEIGPELDAAIARVVRSNYYIGGPECTAFETAFAQYCQANHCVGMANGLDALSLGLRALGIGPGDEVIVPSNTFIASWLAISAVGAVPVPVEPNPDTYLIETTRIEAAITPATRAIMPVHLYGLPADLDPILALAKMHNLRVIEDAAQAHGARYKGQRVGAHGDLVTWSFYPGKNLGAMGDGGAITTNNADLAAKIRLLGNYGSAQKYEHLMAGVNSRLDPIQAAILHVKLGYLDDWTARRQDHAAAYLAGLSDTDLILPVVPADCDPVWHLFVVRCPDRAAIQAKLDAADIGHLIHYPKPPHMQDAYLDKGYAPDAFPIAQSQAQDLLSLPMGPHLTTAQRNQVISVLRSKA